MKIWLGLFATMLIVLAGCEAVTITIHPDPVDYEDVDAVVVTHSCRYGCHDCHDCYHCDYCDDFIVYDEYYYDDVIVLDDYYYDDYYYDDVYVDDYYW